VNNTRGRHFETDM